MRLGFTSKWEFKVVRQILKTFHRVLISARIGVLTCLFLRGFLGVNEATLDLTLAMIKTAFNEDFYDVDGGYNGEKDLGAARYGRC